MQPPISPNTGGAAPFVRPVRQVYSHYKPQDFQVWKTLFDRQIALLKPLVSEAYLEALERVRFSADRIPDFAEVDRLLAPLTGWKLKVVPNISPQKEFFEHLANKRFTATCWLRTMEQLDYIEEPDMFHDVFAHVPLLSNKAYTDFFAGIGAIALRHIHDPVAIEKLGRLYWFTIEFGLIREAGALKIYGAGIISSKGETQHCLGKGPVHKPFDVATIFGTPFRTDIFQETYFIIDSFDQLEAALPEVERLLAGN